MPILRLPGGSLRDEIRQPVYDTIDITGGVNPIGNRQFFSQVQGKPLSQTNLRQNNLLETAVSFRVQGLGIDVQNVYYLNQAAIALIQEHSSLSLKIGEKEYWQGNMTFVSGRVENAFAVSTDGNMMATTASLVHQKYGQSAVASVVLLGKHVIDINPLQSFRTDWVCEGMSAAEISLATPAAGTKLRFIHSLKGLLRRPVQ